MPLSRTKVSKSGLGKALINRKVKEAVAPKESGLYTLDESNPLASVTHERDLDEFLANAALADADFTTERTKTRIVSPAAQKASNPFLLDAEEEKQVRQKQSDLRHGLRIPRRPNWNRKTTRLQLEKQEREAFLDWRRGLAQLAESSNLLLTPFERNIQLWRQLWRVLERSHLIVQIVDARNPLGFRCLDLENYVQEIGDDNSDSAVPGKGKRKSLLLINKADLLTQQQRDIWADYFEQQNIAFAFFSAANAAAAIEQADKQRRRAEGIYTEEEDDDDDDAGTGDEEDEIYASGEEVESQDDADEIQEGLEDLDIAEDEEGWSTEGEGEDESEDDDAHKKLENGSRLPLKTVAQAVSKENGHEEADRTRVLSVTELEDLFISSAPPLEEFSTSREPHPEKLVVGLVGYPNVGKSSTINALLGSKKVSVSATPGKTKHFQTLNLSPEITLCDCPGLVFPQFANTQADMIVDGVLPIDQMREYSAPVDLVCRRIPREIIEGVYGIRIDIKGKDAGGTGRLDWEDMLSAYAIARGMTRASFGMPDTSRAARYVLKDYVNAKLLYAHPPPNIDPDLFMKTSRAQTIFQLEEEFRNGRKRAPATVVRKNADTFVPSAAGREDPLDNASNAEGSRQLTNHQIKSKAATAAGRTGKEKEKALDDYYLLELEHANANKVTVAGRHQVADGQSENGGYTRSTVYPHQRLLGPDGRPIAVPPGGKGGGGMGDKRHFKGRQGKKRSGKGYD